MLRRERSSARVRRVGRSLCRQTEAADACSYLLLERSRDGHAVVALELAASADERVDRRRDVGRTLGHADRVQQAVEELRQVLGDELAATDRGLGGDPPDPVPEMCVDRVERRGSGLRGRRRLLGAVEEQVLDLRRSAQEHLVDGNVTQGLPLLAKRTQRCDQRGKVARDRSKVRRGHGEVPVGELLLGPARPRSGQLYVTDRWMLRNELDRCPREIRHDLIVAPPGGLRLRPIARYSVAAYRFAREGHW